MGRKPTVGAPVHSEFAEDITAYLSKIKGDESVRSFAKDHTTRGLTWWSKIFNGKNALTTDDIAMVSEELGITAYQFVREAKAFREDGEIPKGRAFRVGPHPEDYEISDEPSSDYALAAKKRPNPGK